MTTVPQPTVSSKVYNAIRDDVSGLLCTIDHVLTFVTDDTMTAIDAEEINFISVLGLADLDATARILDGMHGGLADIATHRQN